jgi:hypothetical protein
MTFRAIRFAGPFQSGRAHLTFLSVRKVAPSLSGLR